MLYLHKHVIIFIMNSTEFRNVIHQERAGLSVLNILSSFSNALFSGKFLFSSRRKSVSRFLSKVNFSQRFPFLGHTPKNRPRNQNRKSLPTSTIALQLFSSFFCSGTSDVSRAILVSFLEIFRNQNITLALKKFLQFGTTIRTDFWLIGTPWFLLTDTCSLYGYEFTDHSYAS